MALELKPFAETGLDEALLEILIREHEQDKLPGLEKLWNYYRNPLRFSALEGPVRMAQEQGLPRRLNTPGRLPGDDRSQREIVIENDIAWRLHALIDFMFGKPVRITSLADDEYLRVVIERVLDAVFEASGGIQLLQDMALLGSVYGYVDLLLRCDRLFDSGIKGAGGGVAASAPSEKNALARIIAQSTLLQIETIEAPRSIPLLNPEDYRLLDAYIVRYEQELNEVTADSFVRRVMNHVRGQGTDQQRARAIRLEIFSAGFAQVYLDDELLSERVNPLNRVPIVHIQNQSQPFCYEGLSEVEPLIPLQDELNTRLSDRANRVTMQSFQMYLGKGIEGFTEHPVGPGQMWTTDNPDASITAFGGDASSPSEEAHIREIREAMDKTSAVSPLAAGLVRSRVGNLSSENALRITLMGLLAKTERKRVMYGRGLAELSELILQALDIAGVLKTSPADRRVQVVWPNPLPDDASRRLLDAKLKLELGVNPQQVLAELGYSAGDQGVI